MRKSEKYVASGYSLILGLDEAGIPQDWLSYKRGLRHHAKGYIKWHAGENFIYHGGISRMTGAPTSVAIPSIIAIRNFGHSRMMTPALSNRNLFGRDMHTCAYCGQVFKASMLTRDHIVPRSRSGADSWMNCVTACKRCNNRKDNKMLSELGWKLLYVPYVPNRFELIILSNRNILADQMEFLRAHLPPNSRLL